MKSINYKCVQKMRQILCRQSLVFPRIAVKSRPGALVVREKEKVLDEKITRRTEEVPCPITGEPQIRTIEYIEKLIETEVST